MKRLSALILMTLLAMRLLAGTAAAGSPGDEAAIREAVSRYVEAREKIDPQAIEQLFTEDADQLVSSGEWRRGRPEVVRGTVASSRTSGGSRRTITIETIRMITPNVAVVDGRYELSGPTPTESRKMWTTLLMKKTRRGWLITAIRNMLPSKL